MKKLMVYIGAIMIAAVATFNMNPPVLNAYAESDNMGTAANPYIIMNAEQLQNVNNDVSAHYKLGADIDLKGVEFTPIGNADTGAFSGSFDGNGYVIKNLSIDGGKYAGLFGYNEGNISNIKMQNIDVQGSRFIGGIVGDNEGNIKDCAVESGQIIGTEFLWNARVGGICGINNGNLEGDFSNAAKIEVQIATGETNGIGGIIGYNQSTLEMSAHNEGGISFNKSASATIAIGGVIGWNMAEIKLKNSSNSADLIGVGADEAYPYGENYAGGLVGNSQKSVNCLKSCNSGDVVLHNGLMGDIVSGGILGYSKENATVTNCYNTGKIIASTGFDSWAAGIVACGKGSVSECFNSGFIRAYCGEGGIMSSRAACGYGIAYDMSSSDCYNTGNIQTESSGSRGSITSVGVNTGSHNYNSGSIIGGTWSKPIRGTAENGNYALKGAFYGGRLSLDSKYISDANLKKVDYLHGFDFGNIWSIDGNKNSGYPGLIRTKSALMMNESNKVMKVSDTLDLKAYNTQGVANDILWSISAGNDSVMVDDNGKVKATAPGFATITAKNKHGQKANCNIYIIERNDSISVENFSVPVGEYEDKQVRLGNGNSDYIVDYSSSDMDVAGINIENGQIIEVWGKRAGTTTVNFETASGAKGSCNITVTNEAKKISFESSSITVEQGDTKQLTAETTPSPTSSEITWESADESIASVNQNGVVTGKKAGRTQITVKTDNGHSASCIVNVTNPVRSMSFVQKEVTLYKGDSTNLELVIDPADTTDSISYDSYYTSRAVLSNSSKTGVTVKGIAPGTSKITAESSSGVTATCTVTVIEYPVIVTGISISETAKDLKVGEVCKLDASVIPSNATNQAITWESTDNTVASVSETGLVTAVGAGKAVITATSENGVIASCDVTVTGVASKNTAKIYIPQILGTDEEYVDIPVMIEHNPGINFASLKVGYDGAAMEAVEVQNGTVFGSVLGSIDKENNEVKLSFTSAENIKEDGVLAMIRFKITSADGEKEYPVRVGYYPGEIRSKDSEAVAVNLSDGLISKSACSHTKTEVRNVVDVQCEKDGYTGDTVCSKCGYTIKTGEIIKATGHQFGEWKIVQKATYEKEGIEKRDCEKCSASETRTIPRLDKNKENKERLFGTDKWIRIAGDTRYETALKTANALKKSMDTKSFSSIIVADGNNYPDALAGSYLAKVKKAPLVLVDRSVASEKMIGKYIEKNLSDKGTVYLLGGSDVVTERFEKSLKGTDVKRLAGDTRYETNLEILNEAKVAKEDLLACTGEGFADSLSASAVGKPILLVDNRGLTKAQKTYLDKANVQDIYLIGGADVVSDKVGKELKSYDKDSKTERIAGDNRYKTSVAVAKAFFPDKCDTAVLAYGMKFPDGLAGGPLAISMGSPLLLVEDTAYTDAKAYGSSVGISRLAVLGGTDVISDETAKRILQ